MVRHAIGTEDKQARRDAILGAASALFVAGDGTLPGAAQIAAAAGLAKGTVYLYFRTKEEIFIALLLHDLDVLLGDIAGTFRTTKGRRADKVAAFLAAYAGHLRRNPALLRLDALGYGVLERNLDPAKLRAFKLAFAGRLVETGTAIEEALRLPGGRGVPLLMRSFALTRGLWQSSHAHAGPAVLEAEAALAPLFPDFDAELVEALTEYWRGALAST